MLFLSVGGRRTALTAACFAEKAPGGGPGAFSMLEPRLRAVRPAGGGREPAAPSWLCRAWCPTGAPPSSAGRSIFAVRPAVYPAGADWGAGRGDPDAIARRAQRHSVHGRD